MTHLTLILVVVTCSVAAIASGSTCTAREFSAIKRKIKREMRATEPYCWPARILRAGFHDCLPESCDGSIQFELARSENARVEVAITFL